MAKILSDKQVLEIIKSAIEDPGTIDCADSYKHFLEDLGGLIADHFGGEFAEVHYADGAGYGLTFHANECLPDDGGVYVKYDKDVVWKDGKEMEVDDEERN